MIEYQFYKNKVFIIPKKHTKDFKIRYFIKVLVINYFKKRYF
ncbi:hypothetical protein WPG_3123 [Winogradskyella sp. PG-2]|nr:hypothetical protein WPG_3123 [Winogradskyella sp. PG-2]